MTRTNRRLATEFQNFCNNNEFGCNVDPDRLGANIKFDHSGRTLQGSYVFSRDDNRYDAGLNLDRVPLRGRARISQRILTSQPVRGITERITPNGHVVGLTSRDGLREASSATLHSFFLEDIARFSEASDKIRGLRTNKK